MPAIPEMNSRSRELKQMLLSPRRVSRLRSESKREFFKNASTVPALQTTTMRLPTQGDSPNLPPYARRQGRIDSLHEFIERVERVPSQNVAFHLPILPDDLEVVSRQDTEPPSRGAVKRSSFQYSTTSLFDGKNRRRDSTIKYHCNQLRVLSFLVLLGIIGGPLSYTIKYLHEQLFLLKSSLTDHGPSSVTQYAIWTSFTVGITLIALVWTRISPVACGSGVSQMMSIMTGIDPLMYLPGYFDFATFVSKVGGLILGLGAGLVIGAEGAMVHIMSIVTHHLLRIPMFQPFGNKLTTRLQLLAAACAVGVACTFSTPIGGVLFSMEVTATYYLMSNYLKAFVSSVSGALMLQVMFTATKHTLRAQVILKCDLPDAPFDMKELANFALMGALIGTIVSLVVLLIRILAETRKELRGSDDPWILFGVRWVDPTLTAIATAAITFWSGAFGRQMPMELLKTLFQAQALPSAWTIHSKFFSLSMLFATDAFLLPLCLTLQIPSGVWVPTFSAGAAFGRLYGELTDLVLANAGIVPAAYAIAGAAAFAGAATGTISAAVIAIELTGQVQLMLPIFCATLASMGVANLWKSRSVYETLLIVSGMPYLPLLDFDTGLTAEQVREPVMVYVTKVTSVAQLLLAMHRMPAKDIPVVQNDDDMKLLGVVSQHQIRQLLEDFYQRHQLEELEIDLGEKFGPTPFAMSLMGLRSLLHSGGLNGQVSFDHMQSALTSERQLELQDGIPFLLNDERMLALMSKKWSEYKKEVLFSAIKIHHGGFCRVRPLALTVSSSTPLEEIHMIFTMLRCDHCFVCDHGELTGVVTTKALLHAGKITGAA